MVKIAFNSPFAQKDEPKKEAAEALVADKVRGAGSLRRRVAAGGAGLRTAGGGGGQKALRAAAIFSQPPRAGERQPAAPGSPRRTLRRGLALGLPAGVRAVAPRTAPEGLCGWRSLPAGPVRVGEGPSASRRCSGLRLPRRSRFPSPAAGREPRAVPSCGPASRNRARTQRAGPAVYLAAGPVPGPRFLTGC